MTMLELPDKCAGRLLQLTLTWRFLSRRGNAVF